MAQTIEERRTRNRLRQRVYRVEHAEECSERNKKWAKANRAKMNSYQDRYEAKCPEMYLYSHAKRRAKLRNIEFNIEVEDIVIPEFCPYLGTRLVLTRGPKGTRNKASLDRIDNSMGYVKGNIQVISQKANTMKSDASEEELVQFAERVAQIHMKRGVL